MISIGIDNGLCGGIVALNKDMKIVNKWEMPVLKSTKSRKEYDIPYIIAILRVIIDYAKSTDDHVICILEKAQVSPVSGKNSCFGMGFCFGMMQGILSSLQISYKIVHAKTWQKEVFKDLNGKDTKQKSILFCKRMFPLEDWKLGHKKELDGLTDACCMAYYGLSDNNG